METITAQGYDYAPRVSLSFSDLSGAIREWSSAIPILVVYEHEADEDVKRIHCHALIMGSPVQEEALKRRFRTVTGLDQSIKGNKLWSWEHTDYPGRVNKSFITYMSKGYLQPQFYQGITLEEIEEYRKKWVNTIKFVTPEIEEKPEKYNEYQEQKKDILESVHTENPDFQRIRSWTIRWYWRRDGRMPDAGVYKRNSTSLYMFLRERADPVYGLDLAIEDAKNLWY